MDADGDGFGAGEPLLACEPESGLVAVQGDCDDSRPEVNPDAEETCKTSYDDDCDGSTEGGADPLPWFWDQDGDGVGAAETLACSAPEGAVAQGGDCDDADAALTDVVRVFWRAEGGQGSDLTAAFEAGTPTTPAEWVAPGSGELRVCAGIWYARLVALEGELSIEGVDEGVVLSGGTKGASLLTVGVEARVHVEGVDFERARDGSAVVSSGVLGLTNVRFTQNHSGGSGPGALSVLEGEVSLVGGVFHGNRGGQGGAVTGGTLDADGTSFIENVATVSGGALFAASPVQLTGAVLEDNSAPAGGAVTTSSSLWMEDCKVSDNTASGQGGGAYLSEGGQLECRSTGGTYGFWANKAASGGAAYLAASGPDRVHQVRMDSLGCDWTNDHDNDPTDLTMTYGAQSWYYGDNANFGCNGAGCQ